MKQKIKKELKFVGRKLFGASIGAIAFIVVAGTGIWALAAFTEPTDTPGNSAQDWAKNIMGANNSDNAFDSGDVVADRDGSIIERLEKLESHVEGVTAISAQQPTSTPQYVAVMNCIELNATAEYAIGDSDTSITYTDWRLPTVEEIDEFAGMSSNGINLWTTDLLADTANLYQISMAGIPAYEVYSGSAYYRCVR